MEVNHFTVSGYLMYDPSMHEDKQGNRYAYVLIQTAEYYDTNKSRVVYGYIPVWFSNAGRVRRADWVLEHRAGDYIIIEGHLFTRKKKNRNGGEEYMLGVGVEKMSFPNIKKAGVEIDEDNNFGWGGE